MWSTSSARYVPLLPLPNSRLTLGKRVVIPIALAIFAIVIILGAARTFDFKVTVASKRPDVSLEDTPSAATDTATHAPATIISKEHLSMDEIKSMVSQTRGFYTRDYSLGLGWNNACYLIWFIPFILMVLPGSLYHRGFHTPSQALESDIDPPFLRLCTRMRIRHVSCSIASQ